MIASCPGPSESANQAVQVGRQALWPSLGRILVLSLLADAGEIKQQDVRKHLRRNTLTNYLGGHSGKVKADVRLVAARGRGPRHSL